MSERKPEDRVIEELPPIVVESEKKPDKFDGFKDEEDPEYRAWEPKTV